MLFDATNPPFDRLTSQEVETLRAALDIAYFRPGEAIIAQNAPASALFVVIKGTVEERDGGDLLALLGAKDSFDSGALVHGKSGHAFVAREETLCYTCPKGVTLGLIRAIRGLPRSSTARFLTSWMSSPAMKRSGATAR